MPTGMRRGLVSAVLIVLPMVLIVIVLDLGSSYHRDQGTVVQAAAGSPDPYSRLLIALPVILSTCYLAGMLFRRMRQPTVIGEILAGVVLGPSLLGLVWPQAVAWLFPGSVTGAIDTLSQLGLVFFMFLVGSEINIDALRPRGCTAVTVSQVSIALPMLSGLGLAFGLYPSYGNNVGFLGFALFTAVSMSVTAFPVLARILTDRGIARTPLGALALACAAADDIVAWCLLAVVVAVHDGGSPGRVFLTVALTSVFVAVMVLLVRPLLVWWLERVPEAAVLPLLLSGIMLSALATNEIGIHPIFGAFLFGVISPRGVAVAKRAEGKLESVTVTLLLPLFFAFTGLKTQFGLLGADPALWGLTALIILVAILGKSGGSIAAARLTGVGWRESLCLGALMNCRGLTELVVLNVGLQLKVITPTVFAMLVVMTLVSTVMTAPALSVIGRLSRAEPEFLVN